MKKFTIKCTYCESSFEVKLPTEIEDGKVVCKSNMFKAKCIHCTKIFVIRLPIDKKPQFAAHSHDIHIAHRHPRVPAQPSPIPPTFKGPRERPEEIPLEVPAECITEFEEPAPIRPDIGPPTHGPSRMVHERSKTYKEKEGYWTKPKLAALLLIVVFFLGLANSATNIAYANEVVSSDALDSSESVVAITISGSVMDFDTTLPIGDADVNIIDTGESTVTNPEGFYVIENVPTGEHTIIVSATGFQTVNKKVKLTPAPERIINFELQKGSGTVYVDETSDTGEEVDEDEEDRGWSFIGFLTLIFAILALLGAYLAFNQYMFWVCSTTAFFGVLSFGFGVGMFLGIIAMILILVSKDKFREFNISEPAIDTAT